MSLLYASDPVQFNSAAPSRDCLAHVYGNAADRPDRKRLYPSDMTDAEWAAIRPLLPTPSWLEGRGGQPEGYCHRQSAYPPSLRARKTSGSSTRSTMRDYKTRSAPLRGDAHPRQMRNSCVIAIRARAARLGVRSDGTARENGQSRSASSIKSVSGSSPVRAVHGP